MSHSNRTAPSRQHCVLVIPARRRSTRLPDKMLLSQTGKSLLQHTYEAAGQARIPGQKFIATDDEEIARLARGFGATVIMTSPDCPSGTDRVAEVARQIPEAEIIINLQGDEPEIDPAAVDTVARLLLDNPEAGMATIATPLRDREALFNPACVKVVFDDNQRAMYFSRSPIPHPREWSDELLTSEPANFYQHLGIYAYRRDLLLRFASLPVSQAEQVERLEQLRVLQLGEPIMIGLVVRANQGIDTPEDYAAFVQRMQRAA